VTAIATEFAEWAVGLRWDDVPADVRSHVSLRFADAVGLIAAAWDTPPGRAVRGVAETFAGEGQPLLFGQRPVGPAWSALAHGTLVHTLDYDDTFPESVIHPMSVLLPAALAGVDGGGTAGADLDGNRVMAAIVAGDEVLARLGAAAGRDLHARGFQATGIFGPLAAALVVGVLRGREPRAIAAAMGLAGSMSGGLLAFLADGTWSKRLHPGWAAHGGVTADALGAAEFPGPAAVVEGRHGVFESFLGRTVDDQTVLADLGRRWPSSEAEIKLYPCAHVLHPFIGMARRLRTDHALVPERVREIVCGVGPWYVPIVCEPVEEKLSPTTEYQARTSLPMAVSLALLDGTVGIASFEPASVGRPALRALARRVRYEVDPGLSEGFGARLTIHTDTGTLTGHSESEVDVAAEVRDKFLAATGSETGPARELWETARVLADHSVDQLREAASAVARTWAGAGARADH
jgi:2-methylcitrate dehydratase PrpD